MSDAMKRLLLVVLFFASAAAQSAPKALPHKTDSGSNAGRYQLFSEPNLVGFVFLLDSATGKIWKMNHLDSLPNNQVVWEPTPRFDSAQEEAAWFKMQPAH